MTAAPIAPDALEPALRPFGRGTMLPAEAYTSAEVLAWEQRHFFAGTWTCAGREIELRTDDDGSKPVTQRAISVGDIAVLLTWAPVDRGIRAFANTCRHRGHEILPAGCTSTKRALMCPYHAWTYNLDGGLMGAPGFRDLDGFEHRRHGPLCLRVLCVRRVDPRARLERVELVQPAEAAEADKASAFFPSSALDSFLRPLPASGMLSRALPSATSFSKRQAGAQICPHASLM